LQKLYQQFQKKGGVIIGIAPREDEVARLKQFKTRNKVSYPILIDQGGRIFESLPLGFPAAVLVDNKGVIRSAAGIESPAVFTAMKARFTKLLPQAKGATPRRPAPKRTSGKR